VASGGTVVSGGREVASSGGKANGATLSSGGQLLVSSGGSASGATIQSGGLEYVYAGGTDSGAIVHGREVVSSGGTVDGATISSGGSLTVNAGGTLGGTTTLAGGTATISGAVASGATVAFSGSGTLALADPAGFAGEIAGMSNSTQKIDLTGFAYASATETASWTEAGSLTSGTLTVTDGAQVAHLTILGDFVTSNFTLSTDGHSGTYIVDPPLGAGAHAFVQAMASLGVTGPSGSGGLNPIAGRHDPFGDAPSLSVANHQVQRL
jgi:autotransporter passenger strand-loop-strand repeat protein